MEVGRGDRGHEAERGYLALGVNSGIGAAGTLGEDSFAGDAVDGVGEFALDGRLVGLNLPAMEVCAIVGEDQLPVAARQSLAGSRQAFFGDEIFGQVSRPPGLVLCPRYIGLHDIFRLDSGLGQVRSLDHRFDGAEVSSRQVR